MRRLPILLAIIGGLSFWAPFIALLATGRLFGAAVYSVAWAVTLFTAISFLTHPDR